MSPITRSKTSPRRWLYPVFPTLAELDDAFLLAVLRIQKDAQKLLGAELTALEIRQKLYNSQSQEFWLVNNFDALHEVMYYKMKKNLFTNYKDQLTAAGIEVTKKFTTGHHQHKGSLNNVQLRDKVKERVIKYAEQEISKRTHNLANNNNKPNDLIGLVRTQISEELEDKLTKIVHGSSTDYALFTSGAQIISQLTSRVYEEWPRKMHQKLWGYLTHQNIIKSREPDVVLKPNTNVGECWCFNGTKGQIAIKLSRNIVFTQLALYHIGRNVSIDPISSVPKDFELWGLPSDNEEDVKRKKENTSSTWTISTIIITL
ncbi:7345_t:CDS:2 [Entrophospora sp. SA101]|nr:7345_t:CDS:2 [Entrophospora sp. SA101]